MYDISIDLDQTAFEPGSEIVGRVRWEAAEAPERLLVSLLWHTAGKGTEDIEIFDQKRFESPGARGRQEFRLLLPSFPWSFSGTLISLVWAVEASLEPEGNVDRLEVISAPGAAEVRI